MSREEISWNYRGSRHTSINPVGTHERIAKIRVSKCQILKFLWDLENRQNWIKDAFLSFFRILVPPIFKYFLI